MLTDVFYVSFKLKLTNQIASCSYVYSKYMDTIYTYIIIHNIIFFFLFPVFGLLSDVKTGSYKMIVTDVYFCFASWVTFGIAVIVNVLYWSVWGLRNFYK